nr:MAG TPA: hypothetical protein [Caudoviricetes sp.]
MKRSQKRSQHTKTLDTQGFLLLYHKTKSHSIRYPLDAVG